MAKATRHIVTVSEALACFLLFAGCGLERNVKEQRSYHEALNRKAGGTAIVIYAEDTRQFEPYKQQDTVAGYDEFIRRFPNNPYVGEARSKRDFLLFAPYKRTDTIAAYKEFMLTHPDNTYAQEARESIERLAGCPDPRSLRPAETIVTAGNLSQPYKILGSVHTDTRGMVVLDMGDVLLRSPLERRLNPKPDVTPDEAYRMLAQKANNQYGSKVDAVINATYRVEAGGTVYADGLAVHFLGDKPPGSCLKELRWMRDNSLLTEEEYQERAAGDFP